MAHLKSLRPPCGVTGCARAAVVALLDRWNAVLGHYCRPHGASRLKIQERFEADAFKGMAP